MKISRFKDYSVKLDVPANSVTPMMSLLKQIADAVAKVIPLRIFQPIPIPVRVRR
jgi:hypothetical protein